MKIMMTTDTVGGVWNFSLSLARRLQAQGDFKVHLATMGRKLSAAQRLEIADFTFEESEFPLEWMPGCWPGVDAAGRWLLSLESKIKPDLVHHNTVALAHLPFQVPAVVTVHSCVWSWFQAVKGTEPPAEWEEYRRRVTHSLLAADEVIAPTFEMLRAARKNYGLGKRGRVVANFPEQSQFRPSLPLAGNTEDHTNEQKESLIFAAGRVWDKGKNLSALEQVAKRLDWPVQIAGEGSALGHLSRVEMDQWLSRASIYAWPALYEPFGLSVLEAACHGCALVLGDIASLRETWDGAALFVHTDDELCSALQRLIADPVLRNELSSLALERSTHFTAERTVQGYSEAYAQVLSGVLCGS